MTENKKSLETTKYMLNKNTIGVKTMTKLKTLAIGAMMVMAGTAQAMHTYDGGVEGAEVDTTCQRFFKQYHNTGMGG